MFDIKLLAMLAFQNIYKHCITVITISFDYNEAFLHRYMIICIKISISKRRNILQYTAVLRFQNLAFF